MSKLMNGVSYNTQTQNRLSPSKKLVISFVAIVIFGTGAVLGYSLYYSEAAQVKRLASAYFAAQSNNDQKKMKSLASQSLADTQSQVLGISSSESSSTQKREKPYKESFEVKGAKKVLEKWLLLGDITYTDSKTEKTPVLVQAVKEDGKWKINIFNAGLVSYDDMK